MLNCGWQVTEIARHFNVTSEQVVFAIRLHTRQERELLFKLQARVGFEPTSELDSVGRGEGGMAKAASEADGGINVRRCKGQDRAVERSGLVGTRIAVTARMYHSDGTHSGKLGKTIDLEVVSHEGRRPP